MDLLSCSEFTETMNSFDWFTVSSTSERGIKALLSSSFDPYSPDDQMQWSWTVVWNLQPIEKWINLEWETQFIKVKTLLAGKKKVILLYSHLVMSIIKILEEDYLIDMIL